jgi:hypothetical protein
MMIRRVLAAAATAGIALSIGLTAVPSAFAAEGDGNCVTNDAGAGGDLCLYYNSNLAGARFNDPYTDNYAGWVFKAWSGGDAGAGQDVKNNAASVHNYSTVTGDIYYNSNQQGAVQKIAGNSSANLNSTLKNENASQGWF